ncbi:MAG TPA: DNA gyrase modulator, partial [Ignavibacteria bacterium]
MRYKSYDDDFIKKLADNSIFTSKQSGASYSDFRLSNFRSQNISTRENTVQNISDNENFGFSVRVIVNGAWGFAASSSFTEDEVVKVSKLACEIARANKSIQKNFVELVPNPVYNEFWQTPIRKNPFDVNVDD